MKRLLLLSYARGIKLERLDTDYSFRCFELTSNDIRDFEENKRELSLSLARHIVIAYAEILRGPGVFCCDRMKFNSSLNAVLSIPKRPRPNLGYWQTNCVLDYEFDDLDLVLIEHESGELLAYTYFKNQGFATAMPNSDDCHYETSWLYNGVALFDVSRWVYLGKERKRREALIDDGAYDSVDEQYMRR